jgi:hypothetical protein
MKELPVRTIELKRPLLIEKISEVLYFAEAAMEKLVRVDPESPDLLASPMTVVYETLRMQSVLPRLPAFDKLECLVPDRTPKEVDGMKLWVRQMKTFSEVLTHLDLFTDFSVKDMPNDVGLSPLEEALLSTTPEVVTVSSKRKSTSPSAASD